MVSGERARHYREHAAQLRRMADAAPNKTLAAELRAVADQYERLAERLMPRAPND
jgi:hypothetical protein